MKKYFVEFVSRSITHRIVQGAIEVYAIDEIEAWLICEMIFGENEAIDCLGIREIGEQK